MEIREDHHFTLLDKIVDHLLCVIDRRVEHFGWRLPSSVQIAASQRAPVVTVDNTVWIQHGEHFKDKVLSENFSLRIVCARQKVNHTLHHP